MKDCCCLFITIWKQTSLCWDVEEGRNSSKTGPFLCTGFLNLNGEDIGAVEVKAGGGVWSFSASTDTIVVGFGGVLELLACTS